MLALFVSEIPEIAQLANSGLKEKLEKEPVTGESWIEMLVSIREIELEGSTVGERFNNEIVALRGTPIGTIISHEDLCSLVFHHGWAYVIHTSMLPALAKYLRNGGSLDTLKNEPANATKFKDVMKDAMFRFSTKPVMRGKVGGDQLSSLVEDLHKPGGIWKRLFGPDLQIVTQPFDPDEEIYYRERPSPRVEPPPSKSCERCFFRFTLFLHRKSGCFR